MHEGSQFHFHPPNILQKPDAESLLLPYQAFLCGNVMFFQMHPAFTGVVMFFFYTASAANWINSDYIKEPKYCKLL